MINPCFSDSLGSDVLSSQMEALYNKWVNHQDKCDENGHGHTCTHRHAAPHILQIMLRALSKEAGDDSEE